MGDIVKIVGGDRVPADMVTLYSDGDQGTLFLKTDQLDGETDWKLRKAVKMVQSSIKNDNDILNLLRLDYHCVVKYSCFYVVLQVEKYIIFRVFLATNNISMKN